MVVVPYVGATKEDDQDEQNNLIVGYEDNAVPAEDAAAPLPPGPLRKLYYYTVASPAPGP